MRSKQVGRFVCSYFRKRSPASLWSLAVCVGIVSLFITFQNCSPSFEVENRTSTAAAPGADEFNGTTGDISPDAGKMNDPSLPEDLARIAAPPIDEKTVTHLYVDPRLGNDANSGTIDRPLKTFAGAKAKVRAILPMVAGHIVVNFRMGRYELNQPIEFTSEDSGRAPYYVIYQSYEGERGVISGGVREPANRYVWTEIGNGVYKTNIGAQRSVRQLYIKNRPLPRARGRFITQPSFTVTEQGVDLPEYAGKTWPYPKALEVVILFAWRSYRCPVDHVSGTNFVFDTKCRENAADANFIPANTSHVNAVWLENSPEFITRSEEWAYNFNTGALFFKPRDASDLSTSDLVLTFPNLTHLVQVNGQGAPVRNLMFRTLEFSHSGWSEPSEGGGYVSWQAGYHYHKTLNPSERVAPLYPEVQKTAPVVFRIPAAFEVRGGESLVISGNQFRHLGGSGIFVGKASRQNKITYNRFSDIGATGIQVGSVDAFNPSTPVAERVRDNLVEGNKISRIGRDYPDNVGIFIGYTEGTRVLRNHLFDLPYTGISLGYIWTDDPTVSKDILISENYIHDVMKWLADGGGIYSLGSHKNLVISKNHIRDVVFSPFYKSTLPFATGLYFDGGSRGALATGNQIINIEHNLSLFDLMRAKFGSRYTGNFFLNQSVAEDLRGSAAVDIANDNVFGNYRPLKSVFAPTGGVVTDLGVRGAYLDILNREPLPAEGAFNTRALAIGEMTLAQIRQQLAESTEGIALINANNAGISEDRLKIVQSLLIQGDSHQTLRKRLAEFDASSALGIPTASFTVNGTTQYTGPADVSLEFRWATTNAGHIEVRYTRVSSEGCGLPVARRQVWGEGDYSEGDLRFLRFGREFARCQMVVCLVATNPNASAKPCVDLKFD